jgi:hypothetical protein
VTPIENCPHCGVSLLGDPIDPAKVYTEEEYALPWHDRPEGKYYPPGSTHFKRTIGVEIQGVYDGVLFYKCPDCNGRWHRWSMETWPQRYRDAEPYVNGEK